MPSTEPLNGMPIWDRVREWGIVRQDAIQEQGVHPESFVCSQTWATHHMPPTTEFKKNGRAGGWAVQNLYIKIRVPTMKHSMVFHLQWMAHLSTLALVFGISPGAIHVTIGDRGVDLSQGADSDVKECLDVEQVFIRFRPSN